MAKDLTRLEHDIEDAAPAVRFEEIEVTFGSANTDKDLTHSLRPTNPENIRYQVVNADRATSIYHDQSATRKPWGHGYIILRSSVASAKVTLLLTIPRQPRP